MSTGSKYIYKVTKNESLSEIAHIKNVSVSNLLKWNPDLKNELLKYKQYNYTESDRKNAMRIAVGLEEDEYGNKYTDADKKRYDITGGPGSEDDVKLVPDGKVTSADARQIARFLSQYGSYSINKVINPSDPLPNGIEIYYSGLNSGGLEEDKVPVRTSSYDYEYFARKGGVTILGDPSRFDSYFIRYYGTNPVSDSITDDSVIAYLPVIPQEITDNNSANFNSQSLYGRSVEYKIYNSSSRSVSFSLVLHEELVENDLNYVSKIVRAIESCCYPEYRNNEQIYPPNVEFNIAGQFKIRGILESCTATWTPPFNMKSDGSYSSYRNCNLSISIVETTGPYTMSNIAKMGGFRT